MYFNVINDMDIPQRAWIGFPQTPAGMSAQMALIDGHAPADSANPIQLYTAHRGNLPEWNFALNTSIPLVSSRASQCIREITGTAVSGHRAVLDSNAGDWEVLCVPIVDCSTNKPFDGFAALSPTIDPARARGYDLFRLPNRLNLISSERMRDALLAANVRGASFQPTKTIT
jgi:hypothetical protein